MHRTLECRSCRRGHPRFCPCPAVVSRVRAVPTPQAVRLTRRALTLWQPWAWFITHAGKDVENRSWSSRFRGWCLLHAGVRRDTAYLRDPDSCYLPVADYVAACRSAHPPARGAICGIMYLWPIDPDDPDAGGTPSPWYAGGNGWHILDARPLTPFPIRGHQRIWSLTADQHTALVAHQEEHPCPPN